MFPIPNKRNPFYSLKFSILLIKHLSTDGQQGAKLYQNLKLTRMVCFCLNSEKFTWKIVQIIRIVFAFDYNVRVLVEKVSFQSISIDMFYQLSKKIIVGDMSWQSPHRVC